MDVFVLVPVLSGIPVGKPSTFFGADTWNYLALQVIQLQNSQRYEVDNLNRQTPTNSRSQNRQVNLTKHNSVHAGNEMVAEISSQTRKQKKSMIILS